MNHDIQLAKEILSYLKKRPTAKDTLEGIAEWWLMNQRIEYNLENISRAINLLVDQGFVSVIEFPEQKKFYTINKRN